MKDAWKRLGEGLLVLAVPAAITGPPIAMLHALPPRIRSVLSAQPALVDLAGRHGRLDADLVLTLTAAALTLVVCLLWIALLWRPLSPIIRRLDLKYPWTD